MEKKQVCMNTIKLILDEMCHKIKFNEIYLKYCGKYIHYITTYLIYDTYIMYYLKN